LIDNLKKGKMMKNLSLIAIMKVPCLTEILCLKIPLQVPLEEVVPKRVKDWYQFKTLLLLLKKVPSVRIQPIISALSAKNKIFI
jgi:hypothetical protein